MRRFLNAKTFVCAGFVLLGLYNFTKTYIHLALHQSIDAAAGFMMGLLFALFLYVQVKCVGFVCSEVRVWWIDRRSGSAQYGVER